MPGTDLLNFSLVLEFHGSPALSFVSLDDMIGASR